MLGVAVVKPLTGVVGIGPKLWSLMLAELLLVGDPGRERWVTAGAGMIAVDSLVHNFLHRTGSLRRCGADHYYGPACYAPSGCADILRRFAETIDARQFNPAFPPSSRDSFSTPSGGFARRAARTSATAVGLMTAVRAGSTIVRPMPAVTGSPSAPRSAADFPWPPGHDTLAGMIVASAQTAETRTENLAGLVERVTFHNEENGFCVLRLKARGQRDLITRDRTRRRDLGRRMGSGRRHVGPTTAPTACSSVPPFSSRRRRPHATGSSDISARG